MALGSGVKAADSEPPMAERQISVLSSRMVGVSVNRRHDDVHI